MAGTYYVSFTIESDSTYDARYEKLIDTVREHTDGTYWDVTTSYILFESSSETSAIVRDLKGAITPSKDVVVLAMPEYKTMHVIGANGDQDIFKLVPFAKKA